MKTLLVLALLATTGPPGMDTRWLSFTPVYRSAPECHPETARRLGVPLPGQARPPASCDAGPPEIAGWKMSPPSPSLAGTRLLTARTSDDDPGTPRNATPQGPAKSTQAQEL